MNKLKSAQAQQFIRALRSNSQSKLYANDLLKLKKPIFNDYLLHLKMYAGSNNKKKQSNTIATKQKLPSQIKQKINPNKDTSISHYYCQKNQLLSLKQFVILMSQSKKKSQRQQKIIERLKQRQLTNQVNRNIQSKSNNYIDLRLTSNYVKKMSDVNNNRVMYSSQLIQRKGNNMMDSSHSFHPMGSSSPKRIRSRTQKPVNRILRIN